jgi:hypothetical protein
LKTAEPVKKQNSRISETDGYKEDRRNNHGSDIHPFRRVNSIIKRHRHGSKNGAGKRIAYVQSPKIKPRLGFKGGRALAASLIHDAELSEFAKWILENVSFSTTRAPTLPNCFQ